MGTRGSVSPKVQHVLTYQAGAWNTKGGSDTMELGRCSLTGGFLEFWDIPVVVW